MKKTQMMLDNQQDLHSKGNRTVDIAILDNQQVSPFKVKGVMDEGDQITIETHAKSLKKWAGFSHYFMLYFY